MERDEAALSYTRDTLTCCLLAPSIRDWLMLAKRVLTIKLEDNSSQGDDIDDDDDQVQFHADDTSTHPPVQSRWSTRVFAMECIQKIMTMCEASGEPAHFDLVKAKEKLATNPEGDYLSLHLSDLVRMAFVGATGEADALRLSGLKTLQMIIQLFARAPEPDFHGHLLLEQYQAQMIIQLFARAPEPDFHGHLLLEQYQAQMIIQLFARAPEPDFHGHLLLEQYQA
ncbi:unnamed protein product [Plutella xylostella]|uniref:(diamondback moth) hypothetical protein n=1 Tax=Plutella xylostella TaxID=51655 RepID=A0A8S4EAA3_PLUXY|nr:unnamed protein product [Plutella xylostella]